TVLPVERVKCSFACRRHTVALLTRRHWRGTSTVPCSARTDAPPLKERTCFDIAWRLPCYAPGRRWEKLERFSGIKVLTRRRSTPRLTSKACAHWLISGRWEVHSEAAGTGIERLRQRSAQLGIPIPDTSKFVTELCGVSPSRGCLAHHPGTGSSLGLTTCEGPTFDLDCTSGYGPTLRYLVQRHRTSHRNSTGRPSSSSLPA